MDFYSYTDLSSVVTGAWTRFQNFEQRQEAIDSVKTLLTNVLSKALEEDGIKKEFQELKQEHGSEENLEAFEGMLKQFIEQAKSKLVEFEIVQDGQLNQVDGLPEILKEFAQQLLDQIPE